MRQVAGKTGVVAIPRAVLPFPKKIVFATASNIQLVIPLKTAVIPVAIVVTTSAHDDRTTMQMCLDRSRPNEST